MKTIYDNAEMEVSVFECEDVIATSGNGLNGFVKEEDTENMGGLN